MLKKNFSYGYSNKKKIMKQHTVIILALRYCNYILQINDNWTYNKSIFNLYYLRSSCHLILLSIVQVPT